MAYLMVSISFFVHLHWNLDIFMNLYKEVLCLEILGFLVEHSPRAKPMSCDT